ncbi:hypothetical protein LSTR_LSTR008693 [Laodelphax striatellus]|uniref:Structural maintenance of chromosomes protein 5 n=1 Tax=Laodelphax striatellus TaxID=195883 RepID=A0A482WI23_LAOST|nr:hypothetical protein LSTR_LSTR008693 [Laodelphax striatellus]
MAAEGSIVKLSLKDFMTFDDVTFLPGNKLNLVIGPNGSGKSSLSCAMVLGLAGKTKILGRAPDVGQYVKRGKEEATIEIELFKKNNNNITVRRTMTIDNKTSWHLNDRPSSQKEVEELMKSMHIQVDNLCQFLPQDRVHDFAKMNKQELLDNTQKSVGSPKLYQMFNELKNNMKLDGNHEKHIQKIKDQKLKAEDQVAKLDAEIEKVKRKRKMLDDVANLKRKNAWMQYEEKKERANFLKKKTDDKSKHFNEKEKEFEPLTREIEKAEERYSVNEDRIGQSNTGARMDCAETRKMLQGVKDVHDKIAKIQSNLKTAIQDDSRVNVEMQSLQNELDRVENNLSTVNNAETNARLLEIEEKIGKATLDRKSIIEEQEEKRHQMENIRNELRAVEHKINTLKNVLVKKLALLETIDKHAYKARQFVEENRHLFSGEVYGPMFVELNVAAAGAKYAECLIGFSDKISFLCENGSDVTKLVELCSTQRKLHINAFQAPKNRGPVREVYKPSYPISELRKYGFTNYLLDFVEGPELILRYLCQNNRIHNIPVGGPAVLEERNSQKIKDLKINTYFTDRHLMRVIYSKYSSTPRSKAVALRQPSIFIHDGKPDPALERREGQLKQHLNNAQSILSEICNRRQESEDSVNELFNERNAIRKLKESANFMLSKKQNIRREIQRLENSRINREAEEEKAYAAIKNAFMKCTEKLKEVVYRAGVGQEKIIHNAVLVKKSEKLQDDIATKKEAAKEASQELNALKTELADYEQKCLVLKKDANEARKEALAISDNLSPDNAEFQRRFAKAFAELPESAEEIHRMVVNFQARADCLGVNEQAVVESEKLKAEIQRLNVELKERTDEFVALKERTGHIKEKWLDELKQLVFTINKSFSAVFKRMECQGEVLLTNNGNENDILKYGLTIRVKFREEDELQELDIFRQSGGERAVTIGIYMLSLQELTHVPFRCLDEINQGMDEQNERRVFNTLVETVKKNTTSQYFLLTPKLLNGLEYTDQVKVHVIFNGKGAVTDQAWRRVNRLFERMANKRRHEDSDDSD